MSGMGGSTDNTGREPCVVRARSRRRRFWFAGCASLCWQSDFFIQSASIHHSIDYFTVVVSFVDDESASGEWFEAEFTEPNRECEPTLQAVFVVSTG